jgi:Tfp pilus assembly protein PilV
MTRYRRRANTPQRKGLTLVEVTISTLLVGLVLVGALDSLGAVVRGRLSTADSARGLQLAQQLMSEIMSTEYKDPVSATFGLEADEFTGNRSQFDDVDDFMLWSASPPQDRDGNALPNTANWSRSVVVEYVDSRNPSTVKFFDCGVKRITVTVERNGDTIAQLVGLRSDKYLEP